MASIKIFKNQIFMKMTLEIINENQSHFNDLPLDEFKKQLPYYFKQKHNAILNLNNLTLNFQNYSDYIATIMKYC